MNPPAMPSTYQQIQDTEHLKLLTIFHYIYGGLCFLGCLFGGLYIAMGMLFGQVVNESVKNGGGPPPPVEFTMVFGVIGVILFVISATLGVCHVLAAKWIKEHRNRTFCLVVAGISCLSFPFGTAIGVFTLLVLLRPSVAGLFNANLTTSRHA